MEEGEKKRDKLNGKKNINYGNIFNTCEVRNNRKKNCECGPRQGNGKESDGTKTT